MVALASETQEVQTPKFFAPVPTGIRQGPPLPIRYATTQILFETPKGYPNALFSVDEGLWVADQGASKLLQFMVNMTKRRSFSLLLPLCLIASTYIEAQVAPSKTPSP